MPDKVTRREFLKKTTLAAGLVALGGVWTEGALAQTKSANGKLNLAGIGVGGEGGADLNELVKSPLVNIVALCDVDENRAADTFKRFPHARRYQDFRVMLEKENKNIDAVTVSTPDHVHAVAATLAMSLGKHVYGQKPLAHSLVEVQAMVEAARKYKVVTQMGIQGHPSYARLVEYINTGVIGPVHEVHVMTDRPIWPQGINPPTGNPPIPATLNWDLWLGPARRRPYNPAYLPFVWRGWWRFGTGAPGDMGCHLMDGAFWALSLTHPITIEAVGEPHLSASGPKYETIRFDFPRRGEQPPVTLYWHDGGKMIPTDLLEGRKIDPHFNGSLFVGEKGKILNPHGGNPELLPAAQFADWQPPAPYIPRPAGGHYMEWVNACVNGGPTGANFDYSGSLTDTVLLGNVAFRANHKIEWDALQRKVLNDPKANRYLSDFYRKGWELY